MTWNLSTWAIHRPVPPIALFLILCVVGAFSFARLPVTQNPNVDLPIVSVAVGLPGAGPSEIVSQVVRPIEDAVSDVAGLRHVTAAASDGTAELTLEFAIGTNTDRALNDVKDAVAEADSDLPDLATEPVVQRVDVTGGAILTYAVSDPSRSVEELSSFVDDVVARDVRTGAGVGQVRRVGGAEREVSVDLDPDRLLALGLDVIAVNDQLLERNADVGGGSGGLAGQDYSIRALGSATSIDALARTPIALPQGGTVRLDQIGTVRDGAEEPERFALLDGQPVVAFGVFRATGASDLSAADAAKERVAELAEAHPGVTFTVVDDTTVFTEATYHHTMLTLYEGAGLAVLVVLLFLRDWRATVVTAVALPLSIIPTFIVMQYLGFSLNTVSLLGITLVTGILVDDAIVEIENIVRHIHMGKGAYEASEEAASEIGTTVIAISLTIVAVFVPVSFMGGIAGQYFKQFGITVAVAVLFSLLVARLITPLFAAHFLRSSGVSHEGEDGPLMRGYLRLLGWTLRHRLVTLLAGVAVFALSIWSVTLLPTEFVPATDAGRTGVVVEQPPGSTLAETRAAAQAATARLLDIPEVVNVFADGRSSTEATLYVNYGSKQDRDRSSSEIEAEISDRLGDLPDTRVTVLNGSGGRDVAINVLGDTAAGAEAAARALAAGLRGVPELADVSAGTALPRPEVRIVPRPEVATDLGVNASTLATVIRVATQGESEANLAQFNAGAKQVPIVVRLEAAARNDLSRLAGLRVPSSTGGQVALGAVADTAFSTGPSAVERYDRLYRVTVGADLAPGALLGPATQAVDAVAAATELPPGTRVQAGGDAEVMGEIFGSFGLAMGAGILLVYVVLVLLFASFVTPITILMSLPLAIGGAIFGLYLYGAGIGLSVVIGFLMLMGIVTKNAIMLVEFALEGIGAGQDKAAAMLEAGHKRVRPILMTTIAMAAGMVPSAIGKGEGGEFAAPMAVAVIGGLLLSTVLSLLFVPALFSLVEGLKLRSRRLLVRVLGGDRSSGPRRKLASA